MTDIGNCFLTGTDTEVGKTHAACALIRYWRSQGLRATGYKPVAAGGWRNANDEIINEDASRLLDASGAGATLSRINPICLEQAIAPHVAAADENRAIEPAQILQGYAGLARDFDRVVVEGVGGFRVPLSADFDSADLAVALGLPVVLVVGLRLGCINHALLTAEAILARGLPLAAWIGNTLNPGMMRQADSVLALRQRIAAPCLGILPWSSNLDDAVSALRLGSVDPARQATT